MSIKNFNIPTGSPMVIEFDQTFKAKDSFYLEDERKINKKINDVINQGSLNNKL